ncbi:hypothetical protein VTL71DRAFT_2703 [Oculimacula yallundae]|uniref:Zinc finger protein n=1 Tax=Oculimacula yallundae TaxID=86028 RepID=A0ABR4CAT2_9HELO
MASNSVKQMSVIRSLNTESNIEMVNGTNIQASLPISSTPDNTSLVATFDGITQKEDEQMEEPVSWSTPYTRRPFNYVPPPLLLLTPAGPVPLFRSLYPGITPTMPMASRKTIAIQKMLTARRAPPRKRERRSSIIDLTIERCKCFNCLKMFETMELREDHKCGTPRQFRCSHPGCLRSRDCGFRYR